MRTTKSMRGKEKYSKKDIIIKEVPDSPKDSQEGKSLVACSVLGEYLRPEEWDFRKGQQMNIGLILLCTNVETPGRGVLMPLMPILMPRRR